MASVVFRSSSSRPICPTSVCRCSAGEASPGLVLERFELGFPLDQLLLDRTGLFGQEGVFVGRAAHPHVFVEVQIDEVGDDLLRGRGARPLVGDQDHVGLADVLHVELLPQRDDRPLTRRERFVVGQPDALLDSR